MDEPLTTTSCTGPNIGSRGKLVVIACHTCLYSHLHPLPSKEDQEALYQRFWTEEIPDGQERIDEDKAWRWLGYRSLIQKVEEILPRPWSLLDIGCGMGDFLEFIAKRPGWLPFGVDPDPRSREVSQRWCSVYASVPPSPKVSCVVMNQVLEHLLDPYRALLEAREALKPGGVLLVSTPNDFTDIQKRASRMVGRQWWIHRHHVNYFSFKSLEQLLGEAGFEVVYRTTSFPMELFLFFTDYTKKASAGRRCHKLRKWFDWLAARILYPFLAKRELGRHCIFIARRL